MIKERACGLHEEGSSRQAVVRKGSRSYALVDEAIWDVQIFGRRMIYEISRSAFFFFLSSPGAGQLFADGVWLSQPSHRLLARKYPNVGRCFVSFSSRKKLLASAWRRGSAGKPFFCTRNEGRGASRERQDFLHTSDKPDQCTDRTDSLSGSLYRSQIVCPDHCKIAQIVFPDHCTDRTDHFTHLHRGRTRSVAACSLVGPSARSPFKVHLV